MIKKRIEKAHVKLLLNGKYVMNADILVKGKGIFEAIMSKVVYTEEPSYIVDVDMSWVAIRRTKVYDRRDDRIIIADDNTIEGL